MFRTLINFTTHLYPALLMNVASWSRAQVTFFYSSTHFKKSVEQFDD